MSLTVPCMVLKNVLSSFRKLTKTLLNADRIIISNLETIRNELVPDCNHPKKMNDRTPDGQLYCMNCNLDL